MGQKAAVFITDVVRLSNAVHPAVTENREELRGSRA
jgi:hypothetical protein